MTGRGRTASLTAAAASAVALLALSGVTRLIVGIAADDAGLAPPEPAIAALTTAVGKAATPMTPLPVKPTTRPSPSPPTATLPDGTTVLLLPPPMLPVPPPVSDNEFVSRQGHQLMLRGQPFYFVGANAYWLIEWASWGHKEGRKKVAETMLSAKRLGLKVMRTWGFNSRLPAGPGVYDETQFLALDFIVYAARQFGLRLILALGNLWPAFKPPEDFIQYATGSPGNSILDFYSLPAVRALYRSHISTMLNRVNRYTGLAYKDDPTIMGYDVLNEPRCPACNTPELQNLVVAWMDEMTRHTKAVAPKQMAALGTEGFFIEDQERGLHLVNPGPGAQCEGEDWPRIANLPAVDFSTLHVYERHVEEQPVPPYYGRTYTGNPDWLDCGFTCYVQWMARYVKAHLEASVSLGGNKPMIVEEFGLTWWKRELRDRKVLLAVMYHLLAESARTGGSLAGAMLWNGAHNDSSDQDGYNVWLCRWPSPLTSPPPALQPLPPILPHLQAWVALDRQGKNNMAAGGDEMIVQPDAAEPIMPEVKAAAQSEAVHVDGGGRRRLTAQQDKLDGFRRGWERGECAHEASRTWRPPVAFVNGTRSSSDTASWTPEARRWMVAPDMQAWRDYAWPLDEVDIIYWATGQVNKPGQL